ncbi:MAG: NADP-dependent malic enzyme, partial [Gemmatimonadetes bacterium]|nr:NADP-dependent malic enzyme [Gemmatimonadota bacterium]
MMVRRGDADAMVAGIGQNYPETIRPALQIIGMRDGVSRVYGMFVMILKGRIFILADTTVNIEPTAEQLAEAAILGAEAARRFDLDPRVALLSFSNFGSVKHPLADRVRRAVEIVRERKPDLAVDGEMQADTAVCPDLAAESFPFSRVQGDANVLIFPELASANIAYKLLQKLGGAEAIGPILTGMRKPVQVVQVGMTVRDIVNMAAIAASGD